MVFVFFFIGHSAKSLHAVASPHWLKNTAHWILAMAETQPKVGAPFEKVLYVMSADFASMMSAGVLLAGHVSDTPLDVCVGVGLDKSVDGAHAAGLVVAFAVGIGSCGIQIADGRNGIVLKLNGRFSLGSRKRAERRQTEFRWYVSSVSMLYILCNNSLCDLRPA